MEARTLVIYDTVHGNTEKIARAIGEALGVETEVVRTSEVSASQLGAYDLLVVGAPTHGGRPSPVMQQFLDRVGETSVKGTNVAAFDTRLRTKWVKIFGYAAQRIARHLENMGGVLVLAPQGFYVEGTEGPLVEGEVERAANWAMQLALNPR